MDHFPFTHVRTWTISLLPMYEHRRFPFCPCTNIDHFPFPSSHTLPHAGNTVTPQLGTDPWPFLSKRFSRFPASCFTLHARRQLTLLSQPAGISTCTAYTHAHQVHWGWAPKRRQASRHVLSPALGIAIKYLLSFFLKSERGPLAHEEPLRLLVGTTNRENNKVASYSSVYCFL
jgi:hypothetical protein